MELMISQLVEGNTAIAPSKGERVHDEIKKGLMDGKTVWLDFTGMELMTTAFLNAAIGQLYSEFKADVIKDLMRIRYISQGDASLLKKVTDTAKLYFSNPKDFENKINERLNG